MKRLLGKLWMLPFIISVLGVGTIIYGESLVDLNVTGGLSANANPATFNNGVLIKGANTEFRNSSYDVFGDTVSGGTKYVEFTPLSTTFRQPVQINKSELDISNGAGSVPTFWTFSTPGNVPTITTQNNGITFVSQGGGAAENINFHTANTLTAAIWGSGGMAIGRNVAGSEPPANSLLVEKNIKTNAFFSSNNFTEVASQFNVTSSTTLANVTGLTSTLVAGSTYTFTANLYISANATGGTRFSVGGTATATYVIYHTLLIDDGTNLVTISKTLTALADTTSTQAGTTAGVCTITGTIVCANAGTLTIQFAQNTSNAAASSVLRGSNFIVVENPS